MRVLSQFIFEASLGKKVWHSTATAHFYTRNGIGRIAQKETRESSILFNFRSLNTLFNFFHFACLSPIFK
jgi:hypothetical protein